MRDTTYRKVGSSLTTTTAGLAIDCSLRHIVDTPIRTRVRTCTTCATRSKYMEAPGRIPRRLLITCVGRVLALLQVADEVLPELLHRLQILLLQPGEEVSHLLVAGFDGVLGVDRIRLHC